MDIAIIGGTGVDEMPEFVSGQPELIATRFGDAIVLRTVEDGRTLYFLPRHGLDHAVGPSEINYRAQIAALKSLGVGAVIGVCAVGSLRVDVVPGSFAVLGDFVDLTRHRICTFFDEPAGPPAHTDFTQPYCPWVSKALTDACADTHADCTPSAIYIGVDGPRYETPAEIRLYASWGGDVIGMTNVPEVVLAREAGLCYGALGVVTNMAAGLGASPLGHDDVRSAVAAAKPRLQAILRSALGRLGDRGICNCRSNTKLVL